MSDPSPLPLVSGGDLAAASPVPRPWILHGFLVRGYTTLLTSHGKFGKTTLLSMLLGRRARGGSLADMAVTPGKSLIISEEDADLWAPRARQYGFGSEVQFLFRPFAGFPTLEQWRAFVAQILDAHAVHGFDLVVIDPLAPFLRCETSTAAVLETLLPLRLMTGAGMAVLLVHHPAKGDPPIGQAARGVGALHDEVAVSIEMRLPRGDAETRRRRFATLSRFRETPARLLLEMKEDFSDYLAVADPTLDDFLKNWHLVEMVLEDAPQKFTRDDILLEWPDDFEAPHRATLLHWLTRALEEELVRREGNGRKRDPFRYWLPGSVDRWRREKPLYDQLEEISRRSALPFQSWRERKAILAQNESDDLPLVPWRKPAAASSDEDDDSDEDTDDPIRDASPLPSGGERAAESTGGERPGEPHVSPLPTGGEGPGVRGQPSQDPAPPAAEEPPPASPLPSGPEGPGVRGQPAEIPAQPTEGEPRVSPLPAGGEEPEARGQPSQDPAPPAAGEPPVSPLPSGGEGPGVRPAVRVPLSRLHEWFSR